MTHDVPGPEQLRVGCKLFVISTARLGRGEEPLTASEPHEGDPALVQLWWGPTLTLFPGDRIRYFRTPMGTAFESIDRAKYSA